MKSEFARVLSNNNGATNCIPNCFTFTLEREGLSFSFPVNWVALQACAKSHARIGINIVANALPTDILLLNRIHFYGYVWWANVESRCCNFVGV